MPLFILGVVLTIGIVLMIRGFLTTEPRVLARIVRWTAALLAALVALLLIESGREGVLIMLGLLAAPLVLRRLDWRRQLGLGGTGEPAPGRTSRIETRLLRMTLNHDSGALSGEVISGCYQGRDLADLDFEALVKLLAECRRLDTQSEAVLMTWLERNQGADWRTRAESPSSPLSAASGLMTVDEALEVLGLAPGATPEAVKEAHRRLMTKIHPDHGGSSWLAAKLNQARDVLLGS